MRSIDADHLKRWIISRGLKSQLHPADIIDQIDRESTIEPERKNGKWIGKHERKLFSHPDSITYECSECGYSIYTIYGIPKTTNYCPNCGAEMGDTECQST